MTGGPRSVLLTHECYPPDIRGGGEYVVQRIASGLTARGIAVRVLTTGDPAIVSHDGIVTDRMPIGRHAMNLRLGRVLRAARGTDLIQTFNYHACLPSLLAGRLLGIPVACEMLALFGASWRDMKGPLAGRLFQGWERLIVTRGYDRAIYLSEASRRLGLSLGADPDRIVVNPPGIDAERFAPSGPKEPMVLFAGKMDARKGFHHVIAAARALPDIPFHAVGWADDAASLRAMAPANLTITEDRGGPAYPDLLRRALVLLFPSHAETFGVVMAEAMAASCAIVSTIDTIPFAGNLLKPGDEAGMIAAIRAMWSDRAGTEAMGRANRAMVSAYTWDAHIDRLLGVYAELTNARDMLRQVAT